MLFFLSFHPKLHAVFHPELTETTMVTEGIPVEPMMMFNQNSWGKENVKI
jgi:hypothetical protein